MRRRRRLLPAALVAAVSVTPACGAERAEPPAREVRDSAGVEVVVSRRARWDSGAGWRLAEEPRVRVGSAAGDAGQPLSRVVGAVRTPDGRIAVADGGANRLRFFGPDGRFLRAAGGEGEGPGEFRHLRDLRRCRPDALHAFDIGWDYEVFDLSGGHVRSGSVRTPGEIPSPYDLACNAGGDFAVSGWGMDLSGPRSGFFRVRSPLWLLPSDDTARRLGTWPGAERLGGEHGSRPHPFGKRLVFALDGDRLHLGTADRYEIRTLDPDGGLVRILRRPGVDLSLSEERIERYRERRLAEVEPGRRPELRERLREDNFPDTRPAYDRFLIDPAGRLWVRAFRGPGDERSRWSVFDTAGAWLGDVGMPPRFRATEIGVDHVLGVRRGDLDVPRVELYRIRRP